MAGPSADETYLLELINETRLDPIKGLARFMDSFEPAGSRISSVDGALRYFGVDGDALQFAFQSFRPSGPLAWNEALATAAWAHTRAVIAADQQSHQVPGELGLAQRISEAGYDWSRIGENVYAYALDVIYAHAGFTVDWGYDREDFEGVDVRSEFALLGDGMQDAAGHRLTMLDPGFLEIGISIKSETDSSTEVGPMVVTQNYAAPATTGDYYYITGVAYTDLNKDKFYTVGEGVSGLQVKVRLGGVKSGESGSYSLAVFPGPTAITLADGGLVGIVTVQADIVSENLKLDVVDGNTLVTSGSIKVDGPISNIRAIGQVGLTITADYRAQTIEGASGNDTLDGAGGSDLLNGAGGNDVLIGGSGIDVAKYSGKVGQYTLISSGGVVTVSGNGEGTDTTRGVEVFEFADGRFALNAATAKLVAFGDNATTSGPRAALTQPIYNSKDVYSVKGQAYNDKDGSGTFTPGEGLNDLSVLVRLGGKSTDANGSYDLPAFAGPITVTLSGAGIAGIVTAETTLSDKDLTLDVVNGNTIVTSGSLKVVGEISTIRGIGSDNLTIIGDSREQTIIGSIGNDTLFGADGADVLKGSLGNDLLVGGNGIDTAVFTGHANEFTLKASNGSIQITGNGQGTDTAYGIEVYRFDNGEYIYDHVNKVLVPFGANAGEPLSTGNQAPVVQSTQTIAATANTTLSINVAAQDPDGDTLGYTFIDPPHGSVVAKGSGSFSYTPDKGYAGIDTLKITVSDGKGGTATQTITINVSAINKSPVVSTLQNVTTDYETAIAVQVNASDPDGDPLTYTVEAPLHGKVVVGLNGKLTYTPQSGYNGSDSFKVNITDGKGGIATQTVNVTVLDGNESPTVLSTHAAATSLNQTVAFVIEASDPDEDKLTYTFSGVEHGTVTSHGGGLLSFTPTTGYLGVETFTVTVSDGRGGKGITTVNITVSEDGTNGSSSDGMIATAGAGFKGLIGAKGSFFGSNGFQHVVMADGPDYIAFDPSFNRGGDVIEFPHAAANYIIEREASSVVIRDGDSTYIIPVGVNAIHLLFADGLRELRVEPSSGSIKIGTQTITDVPALIVSLAGTSQVTGVVDPLVEGVIKLPSGGDVILGGAYSVYGTSGQEEVTYLRGNLDLDGSFNKGGDTLHLPDPAFAYSGYLSGSTLMLLSARGQIAIPLGRGGITLDFAGEERTALIDLTTSQIKVDDLVISSTSPQNAQLLDGGLSLDVGQAGQTLEINLLPNTAYTLIEKAGESSFVKINGFDSDDKIVTLGAFPQNYGYGTTTDGALRITSNNGTSVNDIVITHAPIDGFVYDYSSAISEMGWNFITIG